MISFERFTMEDGLPIYTQIIRHIKRGIAAGVIKDREEMPSRRVLSALLGVNPNTIQKAYRLLEEEGIIESHSGAKSYALVDAAQVERVREQLLESDAKAIISARKQMGVPKAEALGLGDRLWDEEETK